MLNLPERQDGDREIIEFDGTCQSAVYLGGLAELVPVSKKLKWNHEGFGGDAITHLTLDEIAEQVSKIDPYAIITVIKDNPSSGLIYQYGNYGEKKWYLIGETVGYS